MPIPQWVPNAVFYQIFPDRFANGDKSNDPANVRPWGSPPNRWDYQGGDLKGIVNRLDYLLDLGINAIYLNPIFHSTANHRYHTIDYFKVDPFLGGLEDFQNLISRAHQQGIKVILDSVLNHCGRGFFAFSDVLENGENSAYRDWFHILKFPLNAFNGGKAKNYLAWWGIKDLPKFNTSNPEVRSYLFGMTRYWLELGIDGWRLDVPAEIDDDEFWAEYRQIVKEVNPQAYLLGEIWNINARWINEDHFDGLMNYPLRDAILDTLLGKLEFSALMQVQDSIQENYPSENHHLLYNTLGSHDTRRVLSMLQGDVGKTKLAFALLFAFPGAPAIYYGDEIGLLGEKEPASRAAFPWDEKEWNLELRNWIKKLIYVRKEMPALRLGSFTSCLKAETEKCFVFSRQYEGQKIIIAVNYSNQPIHLDLVDIMKEDKETSAYQDLLSGSKHAAKNVALPPFHCFWLIPNST